MTSIKNLYILSLVSDQTTPDDCQTIVSTNPIQEPVIDNGTIFSLIIVTATNDGKDIEKIEGKYVFGSNVDEKISCIFNQPDLILTCGNIADETVFKKIQTDFTERTNTEIQNILKDSPYPGDTDFQKWLNTFVGGVAMNLCVSHFMTFDQDKIGSPFGKILVCLPPCDITPEILTQNWFRYLSFTTRIVQCIVKNSCCFDFTFPDCPDEVEPPQVEPPVEPPEVEPPENCPDVTEPSNNDTHQQHYHVNLNNSKPLHSPPKKNINCELISVNSGETSTSFELISVNSEQTKPDFEMMSINSNKVFTSNLDCEMMSISSGETLSSSVNLELVSVHSIEPPVETPEPPVVTPEPPVETPEPTPEIICNCPCLIGKLWAVELERLWKGWFHCFGKGPCYKFDIAIFCAISGYACFFEERIKCLCFKLHCFDEKINKKIEDLCKKIKDGCDAITEKTQDFDDKFKQSLDLITSTLILGLESITTSHQDAISKITIHSENKKGDINSHVNNALTRLNDQKNQHLTTLNLSKNQHIKDIDERKSKIIKEICKIVEEKEAILDKAGATWKKRLAECSQVQKNKIREFSEAQKKKILECIEERHEEQKKVLESIEERLEEQKKKIQECFEEGLEEQKKKIQECFEEGLEKQKKKIRKFTENLLIKQKKKFDDYIIEKLTSGKIRSIMLNIDSNSSSSKRNGSGLHNYGNTTSTRIENLENEMGDIREILTYVRKHYESS